MILAITLYLLFNDNEGELIHHIALDSSFRCIYGEELSKQQWLIRSDGDFAELIAAVPRERCKGVTFPKIDFNTHTLIGQYARLGGCAVTFERQVFIQKDKQRLTYEVRPRRESAMCQQLVSSMNWVMVPRIPDAYSVDFIVK